MTKLSSAGLVYKHYGKEIVAAAMGQPTDSQAVYKYFMEAVDGIDNGKCSLLCEQVMASACSETMPEYAWHKSAA